MRAVLGYVLGLLIVAIVIYGAFPFVTSVVYVSGRASCYFLPSGAPCVAFREAVKEPSP